jgi:agmatinase
LRAAGGVNFIGVTEYGAIYQERFGPRRFVLGQAAAAVIDRCAQPIELTALLASGEVDGHTIAELFQFGLLRTDESETSSGTSAVVAPLVPFSSTFVSCPFGPPGDAQFSVIGAPVDDLSVTGAGCDAGPASFRVASSTYVYTLSEAQRPLGWFDVEAGTQILADATFVDCGDLAPRKGRPSSEYGRSLSDIVTLCRGRNSIPLVIGGDHSVSNWSIRGAAAAGEVSVLHIDAHTDLTEQGPDGEVTNGNVIRVLLQDGVVDHLVTVGVRGLTPSPLQSLTSGHKIVPIAEARTRGVQHIVDLLPADRPCYISLDLDALDPSIAPGTNTPVPNGFLFDELCGLLCGVARQRSVVGMDVVELSPERDPYLRTAAVAVSSSLRCLGAVFESLES